MAGSFETPDRGLCEEYELELQLRHKEWLFRCGCEGELESLTRLCHCQKLNIRDSAQ